MDMSGSGRILPLPNVLVHLLSRWHRTVAHVREAGKRGRHDMAQQFGSQNTVIIPISSIEFERGRATW